MEKIISRRINPAIEDVHHKDEDVTNNRPDNLELLTKSAHRRIHAGWQLIDGEWWKTCNGCGKFLKVSENFYERVDSHIRNGIHDDSKRLVSECKECSVRKAGLHAKLNPRPVLRLRLPVAERSIIARAGAYKGWLTKRKGELVC